MASPPVFYILCGNATDNHGDRTGLHGQITLIRRHFPDATLILDSARPDANRGWYDGVTVLKRSPIPGKEHIAWLKKADRVIIGGGPLLADTRCLLTMPYWCLYIACLKKILKKPVMLWAGELALETAPGRYLARLALNMVDTVTLRDAGSYRLFRQLHLHTPCEQTADPALLLSPGGKEDGMALLRKEGIPLDKPLICLSPAFDHLCQSPANPLPYPAGRQLSLALIRNSTTLKQYKRGLAQLASRLASTFDANILLMPRSTIAQGDDARLCNAIAAASDSPECVYVLKRDTYPPTAFFAMWQSFMLHISVAFDDAMFATMMDCPTLHLYHEPRGQDFFAALDGAQQLMNWECLLYPSGIERIVERADQLQSGWQHNAQKRYAALQQFRQAAERNITVLKRLHEGQEPSGH